MAFPRSQPSGPRHTGRPMPCFGRSCISVCHWAYCHPAGDWNVCVALMTPGLKGAGSFEVSTCFNLEEWLNPMYQ